MVEEHKQSFTTALFGPKDPSTTPCAILRSILELPPKIPGVGPLQSVEIDRNNASRRQSVETGVSGSEGQREGMSSKEVNSSYHEGEVHPFSYNSSIYYGGPDLYSRPRNPRPTAYNEDGTLDESNSVGNWWQGGPYY